VDVRIIAATNVNLSEAVNADRFREDLFYRLRIVPISVPSLRERREDIPLLVHHFIDHFNKKFRKRFAGVTPEALDLLTKHEWSGNVRELKNVIERVMILETGPEIRPEMLLLTEAPTPLAAVAAEPPTRVAHEDEDLSLKRIELWALVRALERAGGNQSRAARLLGVSRDTVRYRILRFGIKVETRVTVAECGPSPAVGAMTCREGAERHRQSPSDTFRSGSSGESYSSLGG
jgi:transcriptional regulator with PAS, ATPase and Fis domain